jgi:hypothetical protein
MARIHSKSEEILIPQLDLSSLPGTQLSIDKGYYEEIPPLNSLAESVPIDYIAAGSSNAMIDLIMTMLFFRFKVTHKDGTPLGKKVTAAKGTAGETGYEKEKIEYEEVGLVNNIIQSMIRQIIIKFNGRQVTPFADNHAQRANIQNTLNNGPAAKRSHLQSGLYFKDTSGHMNDLNGNNKGYEDRKKFIRESAEVDVYGPALCDVLALNRFLLSEVTVSFRVILNDANLCLMAATDQYKITIMRASLFIRRVECSGTAMLRVENNLKDDTAKYPFTRTELREFTIAPGVQTKVVDNMFLGAQPKRVHICFLDESAYAGNISENPFNYQNFGITKIVAQCGGQQFPNPIFEPDFTSKGKSVLDYCSQFAGYGIHYGDEGNDLARSDFANGYAIWVIDLTPDMSGSGAPHWNTVKMGNFRLEINLNSVRGKNIIGLVLAEFDAYIEIDLRRNISFST